MTNLLLQLRHLHLEARKSHLSTLTVSPASRPLANRLHHGRWGTYVAYLLSFKLFFGLCEKDDEERDKCV